MANSKELSERDNWQTEASEEAGKVETNVKEEIKKSIKRLGGTIEKDRTIRKF